MEKKSKDSLRSRLIAVCWSCLDSFSVDLFVTMTSFGRTSTWCPFCGAPKDQPSEPRPPEARGRVAERLVDSEGHWLTGCRDDCGQVWCEACDAFVTPFRDEE